MKVRKTAQNMEPGWKKRRQEAHSAARKDKFWNIAGIAAICLVVGFLIWSIVYGQIVASRRKHKDVKPSQAIARVEEKQVVRKGGKTRYVIRFKTSRWTSDKVVDRKSYDSVEVGKDFVVTYGADPDTDEPMVQSWEPAKYVAGSGGR
jgi:hypothetical protein